MIFLVVLSYGVSLLRHSIDSDGGDREGTLSLPQRAAAY